jgi:pimeloyl-ACP methyl ester carboxylesterase
MKTKQVMRDLPTSRLALAVFPAVILVSLAGGLLMRADSASADSSSSPLVLKAQGSTYFGGEILHSDALTGIPGGGGLTVNGNAGTIAANGMYTHYMIPVGQAKVPVVLIHGGAALTGSCYETTPDGRMGWDEYFVRNGYPVYVPDQAGRGRSGFDPTTVNHVKLGDLPLSALPSFSLVAEETAWPLFRFGPSFGTPFPNSQYPLQFVNQFAQFGAASGGPLPVPNPTYADLVDLAVKVGGAVLVGHSQSSCYPVQAALLNPDKVKGIISIEGCGMALTAAQLAILKKIPMLTVWGDNVALAPLIGTFNEQAYFASGQAFIQNVKNAGGDATFLLLPDAGLHGNSHMMMQDNNNLQVADLLIKWINDHVQQKMPH